MRHLHYLLMYIFNVCCIPSTNLKVSGVSSLFVEFLHSMLCFSRNFRVSVTDASKKLVVDAVTLVSRSHLEVVLGTVFQRFCLTWYRESFSKKSAVASVEGKGTESNKIPHTVGSMKSTSRFVNV